MDNKWSVFYVLDDVPEMLKAAKELPASNDYSVVTIPKSKIMYASFVHRNNMSFMIGPSKVYVLSSPLELQLSRVHDLPPAERPRSRWFR